MAQLTLKSEDPAATGQPAPATTWSGGLPLPERLVLPLALAVYALRVAWAVGGHWNLINPDAVSYIRQAQYLLEGRFMDVVAGYWSPLVSWCMAPFMALGMDGLHALYVVVALWGGILVLSSSVLLRQVTELPATWRLVVLLLIGDATLRWGATGFPDVILAACLMSAAAILADSEFLQRWHLQAACGALGAVGYLGKAYGLPYFFLFLPLGLWFLQAQARSQPGGSRRLFRAWRNVMVVFVLIALPWVGALSFKFMKPTFGLVGPINHAIIGPDDYSRDELWQPVPGRVTVWEIPETLNYRFWSPLESSDLLRHQVAHSWNTLRKVRDSLANFDFLGLSVGLIAVAPFLLMALGERRAAQMSSWVALIMAAYSLPFILVYYDYRYVTPFLKPLGIMVSFTLAFAVGKCLAAGSGLETGGARIRRLLAWALPCIVLTSFLLHVNLPFRPYWVQEVDGTRFNNIVTDVSLHQDLAGQLRAAGVQGPLAATEYWGGLYVAFSLDTAFVGTPAGATYLDCRTELLARGVEVFLVHPDWVHAGEILADPAWRSALNLDLGEGERLLVLVASHPPEAAQPS